MENIHNEFKKFLLDNDFENIYDLLSSINFEELDYKNEINLIMLVKFIQLRFRYSYTDNNNLVKIVKNISSICYIYILNFLLLGNIEYFDLTLEPKNKYEEYLQILNKYNPFIRQTYSIEDRKKIKEKLKHEMYESITVTDNNYDILNKYIKDVVFYNSPENYYNEEIPKKNTIKWIKYTCYKFDLNCINDMKKGYEIIKDFKINKSYLDYISSIIYLLENKDNFIEPSIIITLMNQIYSTDVEDLIIFYKYLLLEKICNLGIKLQNNNNFNIYRKAFIEYYDLNFFETDDYIFNSYLKKFIFNIKHNYYGLCSIKNNSIEIHKKMINNLENLINFCYSSNQIHDLCISYIKIKEFDKAYKIFYKYRERLYQDLSLNKIIYRLHYIEIIINLNTNNIQTIKELKSFINENIGADEKYYYQMYNKIYDNLLKIENLISKKGFIIIDDYDLENDSKSMKNSDNKLVCPICLETVEKQKVTLVECPECHKYIGHFMCIKNYICDKIQNMEPIKCVNCRKIIE